MAENIELQIPSNTEASSRTQNQIPSSSRTQNKRRKCFASFIITGGIVLAIIIAVMLLKLIPQDPTPSAPSDDYEDYYENDRNQKSFGDYDDLFPQTGGSTAKAKIEDVS